MTDFFGYKKEGKAGSQVNAFLEASGANEAYVAYETLYGGPAFLCTHENIVGSGRSLEDWDVIGFLKNKLKMTPFSCYDYLYNYGKDKLPQNKHIHAIAACGDNCVFTYRSGNIFVVSDAFDKSRKLLDSITTEWPPCKPQKKMINVLVSSAAGTELMTREIKDQEWLPELQYADGFIETADSIEAFLKEENQSGLVMLSGDPGTGKTGFIRHLAVVLPKTFIFIPSFMVDQIVSPSFIKTIIGTTNPVLVIEDGEKALMKRSHGDSSLVSSVLNLTDGLLADITKCQVIVSFNCPEEDIDPALLRKGRLRHSYKFTPLGAPKANRLLAHLGKPEIAKDPMTLGEIYNVGAQTGYDAPEKKSMGFGS